jgi:4-amino-4-deoxy-L-arabinose transferase-like glycosyltransferase
MLHTLTYDNHPPLEYSILWAVAHTIGSTETDLRLPSILFGTLMIPMLYLAGRALYDERVGILAAMFGTVGPISVWYSQEARMYALFMLLATVTIWAQARVLSEGQKRHWLIWAAAAAAMIWTQWFALLAVGAETIYFAFVLAGRPSGPPRRQQVGFLVVAVAACGAACAPGIHLLLTQFRNNQASGLGFGSYGTAGGSGGVSPYTLFNNTVWDLWGYHSYGVIAGIVAVWPLLLLGTLCVLGRRRHRSNRQLLALIVIPVVIVYVASGKASPDRSLFEIRYFIEAVPAAYLLLAGLAYHMTPSPRARKLFTGILLVSLVAGLVLQQTDTRNPRLYGYDAAFRQISSVARTGDEILCAPTYLTTDVRYFEPHMKVAPVGKSVPDLPASAQIFVVGSFDFAGGAAVNTSAQRIIAELSRTRDVIEIFQAPNVTVWEFS